MWTYGDASKWGGARTVASLEKSDLPDGSKQALKGVINGSGLAYLGFGIEPDMTTPQGKSLDLSKAVAITFRAKGTVKAQCRLQFYGAGHKSSADHPFLLKDEWKQYTLKIADFTTPRQPGGKLDWSAVARGQLFTTGATAGTYWIIDDIQALTGTADKKAGDKKRVGDIGNEKVHLRIDVAESAGPIGRDLAGQHNWQLDWLDALGSPIARRCCGSVFSGGTWPAEGEYNWERLDEMVEGYIANDRKLILPFSWVPRWLWSDPDDPKLNARTVANFKMFEFLRIGNASPPRDYEKWEELIYQTVKHLNVDKEYGVIFEAWNEPNAKWFWRGTMEESFELYKHTARAVKRADPNSLIGGPTLAGGPVRSSHSSSNEASTNRDISNESIVGEASGHDWMEAFIEYCAKNDAPVDFISWHYYEYYARMRNASTSFTDQVGSVRDLIKKHPSIGNPKLVIDEWSYDWNGGKGVYRTPFNAAWAMQSLSEMVTSGVDIAAFCSSKGESLGAPNPTFGAFEMFNRLGSTRLKTSTENQNSKVGALASTEDGSVSILFWDFQEMTPAVEPAAKRVRLSLENLPTGTYKQSRYLASDTRTDTSLRLAESKRLQSKGNATLEFELKTNGVTLVELTPTADSE